VNIWFSIVRWPYFLCSVPKPSVIDGLEFPLVSVNLSKTLPSGVTEPSIDEFDGGDRASKETRRLLMAPG
jgi:hypothetical protein